MRRRYVRPFGIVGLLVSVGLLLSVEPVAAYGGPGSIISGIGALIAVVAALFASILGFLWFPLKRLIRKVRGDDRRQEVGSVESPTDPT